MAHLRPACMRQTTQNSCFPYRPAKGWTGILTARGHLQAFIFPLHGCFSWPWERLMRSKLKKPRRTWTLEFLSLGLPPKRTWEPLNYSKQQNERMATETNTVQASMNFYISTSYKSTIEFLKIGTNQPEDAPEFHAEKHSTTQSIDLIRATLLVLHYTPPRVWKRRASNTCRSWHEIFLSSENLDTRNTRTNKNWCAGVSQVFGLIVLFYTTWKRIANS